MPTFGPAPFDHSAAKAVGMPAEPSSTMKPSSRKRFTYHSAERYSRQAVSPKSKMVAVQAERSVRMASTCASACLCAAETVMINSPGPRLEPSSATRKSEFFSSELQILFTNAHLRQASLEDGDNT
jgi:hypothetical protein